MAGFFQNINKDQGEIKTPDGKFMGLVNLIGRRLWEITKVNLISFLFYLPFFLVVWLVSYWFIPSEGAEIFNYRIYTPSDAALVDIIRRVILGSILVTVPVTVFGPVAAGATYVYKCFVKGRAVFIWADMWERIKGFFGKAMAITIISVVVLFLSGVALQFYPQVLEGFFKTFIVYTIAVFVILFIFMHFYIYQLLIEYNLSIVKLYRYSFVFSLIRFFPNLIILVVCMILTIAPFAIHILVGNGLLMFFTIGICGTIINYYSWPAIEKHFEPLVKK